MICHVSSCFPRNHWNYHFIYFFQHKFSMNSISKFKVQLIDQKRGYYGARIPQTNDFAFSLCLSDECLCVCAADVTAVPTRSKGQFWCPWLATIDYRPNIFIIIIIYIGVDMANEWMKLRICVFDLIEILSVIRLCANYYFQKMISLATATRTPNRRVAAMSGPFFETD